jgi:hypothetical protein
MVLTIRHLIIHFIDVEVLKLKLKNTQWKPVNVITLGQTQTDNNNQMKIITDSSHT